MKKMFNSVPNNSRDNIIFFSKSLKKKKKSKYQSLGIEYYRKHNVNSRESYKNGGYELYTIIVYA